MKTDERDDSKTETISKLDAAPRQLQTAIRLFFDDGDTVSIHTLTAAAHEILHCLLVAQDKSSSLKSTHTQYVRPVGNREWLGLLRKYENFFKHAERDPDKTLEFKPIGTVFFWSTAFNRIEGLLNLFFRRVQYSCCGAAFTIRMP